ncbi:MAG: hypothetical protein EB059_06170 [Alphaproteobacteria bacterium]|nr:hypothetical protein [Alphaproteobacteria bacterium]
MATPPEFQNSGVNIIQGYGPGRFRIGQQVHDYSLLVSAEHALRWNITDIASMSLESLDAFLNHDPALEVILFGTGKTIEAIPHPIRAALKEKKIGLDVMDTGAACRTYHVLLAEKRRVGCALLVLPT